MSHINLNVLLNNVQGKKLLKQFGYFKTKDIKTQWIRFLTGNTFNL